MNDFDVLAKGVGGGGSWRRSAADGHVLDADARVRWGRV